MWFLLLSMVTHCWDVQKCHWVTDAKLSLKLLLLFYRTFKVVLHFPPLYCVMTYMKQNIWMPHHSFGKPLLSQTNAGF